MGGTRCGTVCTPAGFYRAPARRQAARVVRSPHAIAAAGRAWLASCTAMFAMRRFRSFAAALLGALLLQVTLLGSASACARVTGAAAPAAAGAAAGHEGHAAHGA